ncbi:ABC transporter permease [bacterium]|nr:ABC transporter permease [bacterium]NBX97998.1 ABC transporter permease [bacterium]NDC96041.1 ABC transporter permease [bacterium]NDD85008.1 ABC transporter permease [bacterium]NDG31760.1 ABC transporter permease [bacterium]
MKHIFSKQNKALLSELVRTDFKLRYQGSVLGYAWSLLRPLLMFVILYVVFVKFLKIGTDIPNYPIYLLLGIVLWSFFTEMTSQSLGAIVGRGDLIRKIRIPRWLIIVSTSISALISLTLNLVVVLALAIISGMDFLVTSVGLPLVLLEIYLLALGVSLILSALYVKYRDVSYVWEVCLQAGFYLTPILYPLSKVTDVNIQKLLLLNPMAQSIQDARNMFVTRQTITNATVFNSQFTRLIPIAIVLVILVAGVLYFKKESKNFAENL